MKKVISIYVICCFVLLSCAKQQTEEVVTKEVGIREVIYLYHVRDLTPPPRGRDCGWFFKRIARFKQDTIFVSDFYFDSHSVDERPFRAVYIRDGLNLYRLNSDREQKLFFTMKNNDGIIWERRTPIDTINWIFPPSKPMDVMPNYIHHFMGTEVLLNRNNEPVEVYKFLVRHWWLWPFRGITPFDGTFEPDDFFYFYTKDFLLYKTKHAGPHLGEEPLEIRRIGRIEDIFGFPPLSR